MRRVFELIVAALAPALIAALLVLLVVPRSPATAPFSVADGNAARIAHMAELRPIVLHGDHTELGVGPAGPATTARRPGVPTSISIPALHADASVHTVTTTSTGDLEVPPVGEAGWYNAGARPGEPGRAVIIGHIDGTAGPGVFAHIPEIKTGSEIVVRDARAGIHRYTVVGKLEVPKSQFPASAVYGPAPRPVLVLVTCGGTYVPGVGYSDNVIVYARAAG